MYTFSYRLSVDLSYAKNIWKNKQRAGLHSGFDPFSRNFPIISGDKTVFTNVDEIYVVVIIIYVVVIIIYAVVIIIYVVVIIIYVVVIIIDVVVIIIYVVVIIIYVVVIIIYVVVIIIYVVVIIIYVVVIIIYAVVIIIYVVVIIIYVVVIIIYVVVIILKYGFSLFTRKLGFPYIWGVVLCSRSTLSFSQEDAVLVIPYMIVQSYPGCPYLSYPKPRLSERSSERGVCLKKRFSH